MWLQRGAVACLVEPQDSDERAVANIGGGAPNRWGKGDFHHTQVQQPPSPWVSATWRASCGTAVKTLWEEW